MTGVASLVAMTAVVAACGGASPRHVDYEGHRGCRGLRAENTLDAFAHAVELGVDTLEMDTMLTADDILVIHHDERLNPDITRDDRGAWLAETGPALRSLRLDALRRYDVGKIKPATAYAVRFPDQHGRDGVRIPTLREVIELAEARSGKRIHYNIEIKTTPGRPDDTAPPGVVAEHLVALVRDMGIASRTTIQSFDWRGLRRVAELAPSLPRSCLTEARSFTDPAWTAGLRLESSIPALVHAFGCSIWSPDASTLTEAEVTEAHRLGLAVLPWTVNQVADMTRLISWQVDGLISDFPDRLPRR